MAELPQILRSLLAQRIPRAGVMLMALLLVLSVAACGGSSSDDDSDEDEAGEEDDGDGDDDGDGSVDSFGIGLSVDGLASGAELVITDGHSEITVDANQDYSFPQEIEDGEDYAIEVIEEAAGHYCHSENGEGQVDGEDVSINLDCEQDPVVRTLIGTGELQVQVSNEGANSPDSVTLFWGFDCDWQDGSDCSSEDSKLLDGDDPVSIDTDEEARIGLRAVADYGDFKLETHAARRMGSVAFNDVSRTALSLHEGHYVGGDFDVTGYATGAITRLSLPDGQPMPFPEVLGEVFGTSRDADGYTYIGGDFRKVDGESRDGLARITPDGELDPDWAPNVNGGTVRTLAVTEFGVAVGGDFDEVNGSHAHFALLAPDDGQELGWDAGTDDEVLAVAEFADHVIIGGDFEAGGSDYLRGMDADGSRVDLPEPDAPVRSLMEHEGELLVGGFFQEINGDGQSLIAGLDADFERTDFEVEFDSPAGQDPPNVTAMDADGEDLILGGSFAGVSGGDHDNLVWINDEGEPRDWQPRPDERVQAVAMVEGHVLVGGDFEDIARISEFGEEDEPVDRDRYTIPHLAVVDLSEHEEGESPDALPGFTLGADARPFSVTHDGETLVVAGELSMVGIHLQGGSGIAHFDEELALDRERSHLMSQGGVHDFADVERDGDTHLLAVGDFDRFIPAPSDDSLERFAIELRPDGSVERGWSPDPTGDGAYFAAVASDADHRYLSGQFSGFLIGDGLNALRTNASGSVDGDWATDNDDGPRDRIETALLHDDHYYMAGHFEAVGGEDDADQEEREHLAAFDATDDDGDLTDWDPGADAPTGALASDGDRLFVGRDDDGWEVSSIEDSGSNPDTGDALPVSGGGDTQVSALVVDDNRLFILGDFSTIHGEDRPGFAIATIDGEDLDLQDTAIDAPVDRAGDPSPPRYAFATADDGFCLLGEFRAIGDQVRSGLACFDADGELQR